MPNWAEHTNKPTSFATYIKQNQSIQAHTLILTDIGLEISPTIEQLKESVEKDNPRHHNAILSDNTRQSPLSRKRNYRKIKRIIQHNIANKHVIMNLFIIASY